MSQQLIRENRKVISNRMKIHGGSNGVNSTSWANDRLPNPIPKVLVPWNNSEGIEEAVDEVYARFRRAKIHFAHFMPTQSIFGYEPLCDRRRREIPEFVAMEKEFRRQTQNDSRLENASFSVLFGDPVKELCCFARAIHAKLIVLPTRQSIGIWERLSGQYTRRISHLAPCPVLSTQYTSTSSQRRRSPCNQSRLSRFLFGAEQSKSRGY